MTFEDWAAEVLVELSRMERAIQQFRVELVEAVVEARVDGLDLKFPKHVPKASEEEKG